MRLPLRTFFPYALPGLLAFFGLWWFTTRKKNHAGKQAKHACAKEEDTAAAKRSGLVGEIDPNTQASLSNHGECEEVSTVWGGHTKLSLPVESVGVLDQSCRLSCSTVSTEETAFEKEEKLTLESTPSPDSDNVCAGETNYSLMLTEQEPCSVSEMLTNSFDPLQVAHHLKLNEQDQDSAPELLDTQKTELSAVLQEEVYYPAVQKMDHENIPELLETENVLHSAGSSEVLHTVLKEREQSSVVEVTEMEKGVEPSISLQQQILHVVSVSEEQTGDHDMLECEAYLHSPKPLLQEAAHHPILNDQKQGSVAHLESEKPGQYPSPLQDSVLQHTMFNDKEQDNILESLNLKPVPLYQNAASHIIEKGKIYDLGLSDLQKSVQTSCALLDESGTILNEAKENSVLELPDSDKTHCTSILFQQKSLHLAKDCDLGVSSTSKSMDSEKNPPPPCLLFQKAAYHEESGKLEMSSAFQSESENVQHSSGALQEQAPFPNVVVAQEQRSGLELVESENFPSLCSLWNATHQSVPVPELLPSEKNIQSCSVLEQEAACPAMTVDQVQSFVESLESCETEHSSKVLQQDTFLNTKLANLTDSGNLEIGPEATLHPSISSQLTVQPTLSEQEQSSDCQSEGTEKILGLALPQQNALQDTLHEQEQNIIPEISGPEKMLLCSIPCHMEDAHYTRLTEQEQIASDEVLQLENGFCFSSQLQLSTVTKPALLSNRELCDSSGEAQEMEGNSNSTFAEKPKSLKYVPTDIHRPCTEAAPMPENEVEIAVLASPTVEKITGPVEVHDSLANTGKITVEKTLTSIEAGSHELLETKFSLGTSVTCNDFCADNFELLNSEENITLDMVIEESAMKAINRVASDLVSKIIEAAVHEILSSVDHKTEMHPTKTDMKVEQVVCRLEIGEVDNVLHGKTSTLVKRVEDLKVEIENRLILDSSLVKAPPNDSEDWKQKVDTECSGNEYSDEADMKNQSVDFSVPHRLREVSRYCAEKVKDVPESSSLIAEDSGCSTCTSEDGMCSEDPLQSTPLSSVLVDVLGESVIKEVLSVQDVEPATVKQAIGGEVEHDISYSKETVARNYVTKNESQWSAEVDNSGGSDVNSMDSGDSGCGLSGSEHHLSQHASLNSSKSEFTVWEIEVPKHLVGRLIGKQGRYVSYLKQISGAKIYITTVPYTQEFQICHIEGSQQQVDKALSLIGEKFRELDLINIYAPQRSLTLPSLPMTSWLSLPEGVTVEVIVVSVISAGHVFVQQHTHPTFHALRCLDHQMRLCYSQPGIPAMPAPVVGVICAAPAADGAWWRAQVVAYYKESNEADIRYVDYGGYEKVQLETLRQIRSDFVTLPFQGVEVLLDNIAPLPGEDIFLSEADTALVEMTRGCSLLAQVTNYESSSGLPLIQLWNIMGDEVMSVNRTLVERGLAQWIDSY